MDLISILSVDSLRSRIIFFLHKARFCTICKIQYHANRRSYMRDILKLRLLSKEVMKICSHYLIRPPKMDLCRAIDKAHERCAVIDDLETVLKIAEDLISHIGCNHERYGFRTLEEITETCKVRVCHCADDCRLKDALINIEDNHWINHT